MKKCQYLQKSLPFHFGVLVGTVLAEPPGKRWLVPSQGKVTSLCIQAARVACNPGD